MTGEVIGFVRDAGQMAGVKTKEGDEVRAEKVVLAGGIATSQLTAKLGYQLPMEGGKGYSLTLKDPCKQLRFCSLLKEGRVAVTPMGKTLRVAGTMEICGRNLSLSPKRLEGIVESFCRFYPDFEKEDFCEN